MRAWTTRLGRAGRVRRLTSSDALPVGAGLIKAKSTELVWWLVVGLRFVILLWVLTLKGELPPG